MELSTIIKMKKKRSKEKRTTFYRSRYEDILEGRCKTHKKTIMTSYKIIYRNCRSQKR